MSRRGIGAGRHGSARQGTGPPGGRSRQRILSVLPGGSQGLEIAPVGIEGLEPGLHLPDDAIPVRKHDPDHAVVEVAAIPFPVSIQMKEVAN